ncbi:nucleoid-associated protein [Mariluticola halotolerans]|uniref:nucleoid-associated protein n=1 Tax=Mariluticola halotolerans TaxID=2909283 RepID=UPI0026E1C09F|nr:nucleoid-associated protein [Mariluticola halotolerans]UJQ94138.1 nucleoid-associated protein [Mariluticola halotolerans]
MLFRAHWRFISDDAEYFSVKHEGAILGILDEDEITTLSINRMILHVVGDPDSDFNEQPEFEQVEHDEFFLARLQDVDVAPVHEFAEFSETKRLIESIAKGDTPFEKGAQRISRLFAKQHRGNSSDGAFFIFELISDKREDRVYALAKYDYSQAIERFDKDGKSGLRQIVQAFIADRKAIQKSCFVRVVDGVARSAVSARDRTKQAPDLTDYFAGFLDVSRTRSNNELSKALDAVVLRVLKDCKDVLPKKDVRSAYKVAREALRQRDSIDNEAAVEAVLLSADSPEDEGIRTRLEKTVRRVLRTSKLDGVTFKPDRTVFTAPKRQKVQTAEGVNLDYPGSLENNGVSRQAMPGGGTRFIIETAKDLVVDVPIIEKVRA